MTRPSRRRGFTLIEILVVVAIIALLISILLPSLARAKAMSRMVQCQSNLKQLGTAFAMYVVENKGRYPGMDDYGADWLGKWNKPNQTGRNPDDGVIFKHMGKNKAAYACPDDNATRTWVPNPLDSKYSYTSIVVLDGAKPEMLSGAHYRRNFDGTNHTADMRPFEGTPVLIEEDAENYLVDSPDSAWGNNDCITTRHLATSAALGYGNISFHDTHVGRVQLMSYGAAKKAGKSTWFEANCMCIRARKKWISPRDWNGWTYGELDNAPASSITH